MKRNPSYDGDWQILRVESSGSGMFVDSKTKRSSAVRLARSLARSQRGTYEVVGPSGRVTDTIEPPRRNPRKRASKRTVKKVEKRISASLSRFLKKQNPAMKKARAIRVKKFKGGAIKFTPVK
jgi:hypothetical protein